MKILTGLITALLGTTLCSAQEINLPLKSKGEIPPFIKDAKAILTYPQAQTFYFFDAAKTDKRRQVLLDHIYASGRVIFGNEANTVLQGVFSNLKESMGEKMSSKQAFLVSSATPSVFHGNDQLFITTALFAQCDNENQLSYFLLRGECIKANSLYDIYAYKDVSSVESAISSLNSRSIEQELEADSRTIDLYKSLGLSDKELDKCLNIVTYIQLPYDERKVTADYFNSNLMHVPYDFFTSAPLNQSREINSGISFTQRIESYKNLKKNKIVIESTSWKKADKAFENALREVRYQLAYDLIVAGKPAEAIYTVFLLEDSYGENETSIWLKSHAWLNLAANGFRYNPETYTNSIYQEINSDSQRFYRGLKKMNAFGVSSMALRLITDWEVKATSNWLKNDLKSTKESLIDLLTINGNFPLDKFSNETFEVAMNIQTKVDSVQTRFEKLENSTDAIDTNSFYLYAISDYMSDSSFVQKIRKGELKYDLGNLNINQANVYRLSKTGELDKNKSMATTTEMHNEIAGFAKVQEELNFDPKTIETYHQTRIKHDAIEENYSQVGEILWNTLNSKHFASEEEGATVDFIFSNYYSLSPRAYHSFGLLIVPLPIILPDLILGGNHSELFYVCWSQKDGKMIGTGVQNFKDPATGLFLGNKIYELLNTLN